ncbi:MAG: hypothetical protein M0Z99_16255 [Betaproteobacteria bacterium]|jgi:hypothetical protein|nr:hypothetical protein [Betaproteobacteria bacterium]
MKRKPLSMPLAYATIGPRPQPGGPRTALQELYAEQCEQERREIERRAAQDLRQFLIRIIARIRAERSSK